MKYTKIIIMTNEVCDSGVELLTSNLTDLGAEGFEISGGEDLQQLIDSTDPDLIDDEVIGLKANNVSVTVYIPQNGQGRDVVVSIKSFLESKGLEYSIDAVCEEDWANNWKKYFKPITVGERLVVKPSWENYDNADGRLIVEIDPSRAFGTGQHATTVMCLELLEKYVQTDSRVIDIGCGSGILAAAAGLLGAGKLTAVDICETAIRVTNETFTLNNISKSDCSVFCGNVITDEALREKIGGDFDIAVANITADVIIAMADLFPSFTENTLILSGIIALRLHEALTAIEPHFNVVETYESGGWNALVCTKPVWNKK